MPAITATTKQLAGLRAYVSEFEAVHTQDFVVPLGEDGKRTINQVDYTFDHVTYDAPTGQYLPNFAAAMVGHRPDGQAGVGNFIFVLQAQLERSTDTGNVQVFKQHLDQVPKDRILDFLHGRRKIAPVEIAPYRGLWHYKIANDGENDGSILVGATRIFLQTGARMLHATEDESNPAVRTEPPLVMKVLAKALGGIPANGSFADSIDSNREYLGRVGSKDTQLLYRFPAAWLDTP